MLCENCKKNTATTHIRTVINGVVIEKNLCGYCAAMSGYSKFVNNGFASMLTSMFSDELASATLKETRCECCNTRFSDIAESGKMGCSECYETFKKYEEKKEILEFLPKGYRVKVLIYRYFPKIYVFLYY